MKTSALFKNVARRFASRQSANVKTFYEPDSSTASRIVSCPDTKKCVIIDPVFEYDMVNCRLKTNFADELIKYVEAEGLECEYILETHVHADHVTSAKYLQKKLAGNPQACIGDQVTAVQESFKDFFNLDSSFDTTGKDFDMLLKDNTELSFGKLAVKIMHTPGHTPACAAFVIGDNLFPGDTVFMPDSGTARCDFPGGSASQLYHSIKKMYALPEDYKVHVCHDYQPGGRDLTLETTIGAQKRENIHLKAETTEEEFVAFREGRDAQLNFPKLIMASVQINLRNGDLDAIREGDKYFVKYPVFLPKGL